MGRVTIPKRIREALGLQPGDEVIFEDTPAGFVLRKPVSETRFEKWRGAADTEKTVEERMSELRGGGP